jgi:hypothetical protein
MGKNIAATMAGAVLIVASTAIGARQDCRPASWAEVEAAAARWAGLFEKFLDESRLM